MKTIECKFFNKSRLIFNEFKKIKVKVMKHFTYLASIMPKLSVCFQNTSQEDGHRDRRNNREICSLKFPK